MIQFELLNVHYNAPPKKSDDGLSLLQQVVVTTGIVGNTYTTDVKFIAQDIVTFRIPLSETGDQIEANIQAQAVAFVDSTYPTIP